MGDAAVLEPTSDNDGFSPEERAQFEGMRTAEPAAPEGAPVDPAPAQPDAAVADKPVTEAAPAEGAAADDDDGEDDAPAATAPGAAVDPNARQPRRVAYGKFQRLEAKYKELQARSVADAETKARLDERLKLINEALTPANQPVADEDPEPDPEKDIFGYVQWQKRALAKQGDTIKAIQEGRQTETEDTRVANTYLTDAEQLAREEPNFVPAYQHLMGVRLAQLAMYYYGKDVSDPEAGPLSANEINHIRQIAAGEEKQVVAEALKAGQRPAQRIYQLARASGFRPQAAVAANGAAANGTKPGNGAAQNGNGSAASAAQNGNGTAPKAPSVADEIDRIKSGQDAALSLSGGGGAPSQPMTAERLATMPQAEFEAWMERTPEHLIRQVMGG